MIFIHLTPNHASIVVVKASLFGKKQTLHVTKTFSKELITKDFSIQEDVAASALRELFIKLSHVNLKKEKAYFILPYPFFTFKRSSGKAPEEAGKLYASYAKKSGSNTETFTYGVEARTVVALQNICSLLDVRYGGLYPTSEVYYALFSSTLKADKSEFVTFATKQHAYTEVVSFDNLGRKAVGSGEFFSSEHVELEDVLKKIVNKLIKENEKPHRVIISGEESAGIRQDFITKAIGAWVNLLKKITPEFYGVELASITPKDGAFPYLMYDGCFGAYILYKQNIFFPFAAQNKQVFSMPQPKASPVKAAVQEDVPQAAVVKKPNEPWESENKDAKEKDESAAAAPKETTHHRHHAKGGERPTPTPFLSWFLIFLAAMVIGFGALWFLLPLFKVPLSTGVPVAQATPTPQPTATPTPTPLPLVRANITVTVLNGNGTSGLGNKAKKALTDIGYKKVTAKNADSFNYETSSLKVSTDLMPYKDTILKDFADFGIERVEELKGTAAGQIELLLGKDATL